jgi:hypothetical protein
MSTSPTPSPSELSFDRATPLNGAPAPDACAFCQTPITGEYYRVAGRMTCSPCAARAESLTPPNAHSAFVRATLFGIGAAILVSIVYSLIKLHLSFNIGYFAIGVGWVIGKAMHLGAKGNGGRRYQIIAAILTYVAITMADVPSIIRGYNKSHPTTQSQSASTNSSTPAQPSSSHLTFGGVVVGVGALMLLGLSSPILILFSSPGWGLLNIFIILIGVQFAWRFTAPPKTAAVEGPYNNAPA